MGKGSRPKYQHMLSVVQKIAEGHPQLVPPLGDNIDHAQLGGRRGSHFWSYWRGSKLRPTWYGMVNETFVHIRCTMNMHPLLI